MNNEEYIEYLEARLVNLINASLDEDFIQDVLEVLPIEKLGAGVGSKIIFNEENLFFLVKFYVDDPEEKNKRINGLLTQKMSWEEVRENEYLSLTSLKDKVIKRLRATASAFATQLYFERAKELLT
jgi:hypothetical protein